MGAWSDELFGNDLAADVAGEYRHELAESGSVDAGVKRVRREFAEPMRDADERRIVWIALAAAQLEAGTVSDDVRSQALKAIAWCESPARDPEDHPFGADALAKLREGLGGKAPVAKPPKPKRPPGAAGEVFAVSLPNAGGEAVVYVAGLSKKNPGEDVGCVVWLYDLTVDAVTPETVSDALRSWRSYRQVWPNGLGRGIGCYEAKGALPARRSRRLLQNVPMPPDFERRVESRGVYHKSADLPWVVENDLTDWKESEWAADPESDF